MFDTWQLPLLSLLIDLQHEALQGARLVGGEHPDVDLLV
jgi:hypothetical protein